MPEELGVGTIAEWNVPSSGIKKEVSVKNLFGVLCSQPLLHPEPVIKIHSPAGFCEYVLLCSPLAMKDTAKYVPDMIVRIILYLFILLVYEVALWFSHHSFPWVFG